MKRRKGKVRKPVIQKTMTALLSTRRLSAVCLSIVLVLSVIIPLIHVHPAQADSNLSQSDWSDGVGVDPDHQFTSIDGLVNTTPNQLTVDTSNGTYTDWCNTANCTSDWTKRQFIHINNGNASSYTDYQIRVDVTFKPSMKADFSDLRFTSADGSSDLNHWVQTETDSQSAVVFVKVPTLNAGSNNKIAMYYGNGSASSTSNKLATFQFADGWDVGNGCATQYTCLGNPSDFSLSNGEVRWLVGSTGFGESTPQDRSVGRSAQIDIKRDLSEYSCSDEPGDFGSFGVASTGLTSILNMWKPGECDGDGLFWSLPTITNEAGSFNEGSAYQARFRSNEWATIRITALAEGGQKFEFSHDGGKTFIELNYYLRGTETTPSGWFFGTGGAAALNMSMRNLIFYQNQPDVKASSGIEETIGGYTGQLESVVYDLQSTQTGFDNIHISNTGTGNVGVYVRTGINSPSSAEYLFCGLLEDGDPLSDTACGGGSGQRYIQYLLVESTGSSADLTITNISIDYFIDTVAPTTGPSNVVLKSDPSGLTINNGEWSKYAQPYASWTAGSDDPGGSGLQGYCVYVGTDSNADTSTKGIITSSSPVNAGVCEYVTPDTNFNGSSNVLGTLTSGQTYYIRVRAIDRTGNLSTDIASASFRYDNAPPYAVTLLTYPSAVNNNTPHVSWLYVQGLNPGFADDDSGVAGAKYCVTSLVSGLAGCTPSDNNWYGPNHTTGRIDDPTDAFPASDGQLTVSALDADRLDDSILGYNSIYIALVDNAGNYGYDSTPHIFQISHVASDAPNNLSVTPTSSNANNFSFTWSPPTTLYGHSDEAEYCWSVNITIETDGSNCNWTGKNVYSLSQGPYATQQGLNTMYIATKDVTGNFDGTKFTSITFTTNTVAPGTPQNLDIADISTRATSTWKLALTWSAPEQTGAGITSYRILRSTDDTNYDEVGSTSGTNTSFIDSGLSQQAYYYKVKACDNANSCGIESNSASKTPTGRFTEPAKLTADTDQPKIKDVTTRKATVYWFTDRESDSRIALGTSSGHYFTQEIGNSMQTTSHSVQLTNLEPGTTYYYVAKWTDQDGNTGQSQEHTLTTIPAPSFSDVVTDKISISGANISLTSKYSDKISLYYGKSEVFGEVKTIDSAEEESRYTIQLNDLADGTKYYFKVNGYDADGNEYQGDIYSFTTPARPRISGLSLTTVEGEPSSTKKVTWSTNVPSNSVVSYTPKGGVMLDAITSDLTQKHEVIVRGLLDDTDYTLTAKSTDAAGNTTSADVLPFHTELDTRPPKISNLAVETTIRGSGSSAKGQIILSWKTDEPATSQIAFGQGETGAFTGRTPEDSRLTLEHTMVLSDVATSALYHIEAVSQDHAGNSAVSESQSAIVGRASDNIFNIILTSLQKIFGVKSS